MTDTNYNNNYNNIFKNNYLKFDKQMTTINKFDIDLNSKSFSKINYRDWNNKLFQNNSFINDIL